MGGAELFLWKVIEPSPVFATVCAYVYACERGHNFALRLRRVDLYAVGAKIGACLICTSMQQKGLFGYSSYSAGAGRIIDSPTGCQMKASDNTHSVYRRVRSHSIDTAPSHCMEIEKVDLVAGSNIEIAWVEFF